MFGYVRPCKGEMKVSEYEGYRAAYCGLCHALGRRCGWAARYVVNYDFVFLAMLFADSSPPCWESRRCVASPFKKRRCLKTDGAMDAVSDFCVILAYWKLRDSAGDEGFFKALPARAALMLLRSAMRRASKSQPEFAEAVRLRLLELSELEEKKCPSLDMAADKFAKLLECAADIYIGGPETGARKRALRLLLYHVGRIVYILDAVNDLRDDVKSGAYNPLIYRFAAEDGVLSEADTVTLKETIESSRALAASAFELLDTGAWCGVLANIVYDGIPKMTQSVFTGTRAREKGGERHGQLINTL